MSTHKVAFYPSFFNDVFGPVMLAGSSSHLAAPQRIGILTHALTQGKKLKRIEVLMDSEGSFAGTFGLMSEDIGMCAGGLGLPVDAPNRNECFEIAQSKDIEVKFTKGVMKESDHNNAMKFILTTVEDEEFSVVGDSIGGGMIETKVIQGFPYRYKGDINLVIITKDHDSPTMLDAVKQTLGGILSCDISRANGSVAYFFQAEQVPQKSIIEALVPDCNVFILPCILPTQTSGNRQPQLFDNSTDWLRLCNEQNKAMHEVAIDYQVAASGMTPDAIIKQFDELANKMIRQVECMENEDFGESYRHCYGYDTTMYRRLREFQESKGTLSGVQKLAVQHYFSVASMAPGVPNVPGPHGAGGGVIMSCLRAAQKQHGFNREKLIEGLLVAAGYGAIAYTRTEPTGEVLGCAGEHGLAMVMATAALTHIMGGSPEQVESAAAQSMQLSIGWPCDPVMGTAYGEPCMSRGITAATMPFIYTELALAGLISPFPFHEMLDVAKEVATNFGQELLCTGRGGCAACPTACSLKNEVGMK